LANTRSTGAAAVCSESIVFIDDFSSPGGILPFCLGISNLRATSL
jgi:hypothetical protein